MLYIKILAYQVYLRQAYYSSLLESDLPKKTVFLMEPKYLEQLNIFFSNVAIFSQLELFIFHQSNGLILKFELKERYHCTS